MVRTIASVGDRRPAFWAIATFTVAATLSGSVVGALAGLLGESLGVGRWPLPVILLVTGTMTLLAAADDLGRLGIRWPYLARQVAAGKWDRHGPIGAAATWGMEQGSGVLTHVPSALLYALLTVCLLGGTTLGALLYGSYGAIRASQLLLARRRGEQGWLAGVREYGARVASVLAIGAFATALITVTLT